MDVGFYIITLEATSSNGYFTTSESVSFDLTIDEIVIPVTPNDTTTDPEVNTAPYFSNKLKPQKLTIGTSAFFIIPPYFDDQNDIVTLTINLNTASSFST